MENHAIAPATGALDAAPALERRLHSAHLTMPATPRLSWLLALTGAAILAASSCGGADALDAAGGAGGAAQGGQGQGGTAGREQGGAGGRGIVPLGGFGGNACASDGLCPALASAYLQAVAAAQACNPFIDSVQCQHLVDATIICGCAVPVNDPTLPNQVMQAWHDAGCARCFGDAACGACPAPPPGARAYCASGGTAPPGTTGSGAPGDAPAASGDVAFGAQPDPAQQDPAPGRPAPPPPQGICALDVPSMTHAP